MVKPRILKGNNNNHTNGKIKIKSIANGQQIDNKINQRIRARRVRISE